MSKTLTLSQAAIAWVERTRRYAVTLDAEADALLTQLHAANATEIALETARQSRACIGLYGYSQSAKAHLLSALCSSGNGRMNVVMPDRYFDYFSHINPGHAAANMALRFTRQASSPDDEWPLRLRLLAEAELVQIFITMAHAQPACRQAEKAMIESRLEKWRSLRQRHPVPGVTAAEVATVARFCRQCRPASQQQIDDALWHQFALVLPYVDLTTRASIWSLLWGEQPELTQQWLALAHVLQQTGNAGEVAAPLSLLVDQFGLPSERFITQEAHASPEAQNDVVVHPVVEGALLAAVSLPQDPLALLTRELVLSVEDGVLDEVDLLDIPLAPVTSPQPLWQAKLGWLLEHYRQQRQPDVLVICNATANRTQTPATARRLLNWVHETQPLRDTALPGVVWAITPQDARFVSGENLDETIQQLMGNPGQHWGTLQALDKNSLQRLIEWLSHATSFPQRQARIEALHARHRQYLRELLCLLPDNLSSAETVVRELQQQAAHHGDLLDGLVPEVQQFESLLQIRQPREEQVSGLFNDAVDLFAEVHDAPQTVEGNDTGDRAHKLWINHLRQWSRDDSNATRLGLKPATLRQVVAILIAASYRLQLAQQLQQIVQQDENCGAQLHANIANFVAWLGYADVEESERPASRMAKGETIFSAAKRPPMARLTALNDRPVHAASRYVYDWLVALYTRAQENNGFSHPHEVTPEDKNALNTLLSGGQ